MRQRVVKGVLVLVVVLLAGLVAAQLAVALPRAAGPAPTPATTKAVDWTDVPVGADASWPSCTPPSGTKRTLPLAERPAFVVVGVNDGLPGTRSACIEREVAWSRTTTGGSSQPRLAYYALAADPWTEPELTWVKHPAWPSSNAVAGRTVVVPAAYGSKASDTTCSGGHAERACAYVFGWATALRDAALPGVVEPSSHRWWVDVEAERTWSDDRVFNQAVVEGMTDAFAAAPGAGGIGATAGLYSTPGEWARIIGPLREGSPLGDLDEWLAIGAATEAEAVLALRQPVPFVWGGRVVMVQFRDGAIDRDVAAPAG